MLIQRCGLSGLPAGVALSGTDRPTAVAARTSRAGPGSPGRRAHRFRIRIHRSGTKAFVVNYRTGDSGRKTPNKRVVLGRNSPPIIYEASIRGGPRSILLAEPCTKARSA